MYSTCLFCNNNLGRNESIEHFTVGRRLAYDAARGRLWVVCARCERWNLTPLETRWEAIEEAERSYRTSKVRVASDNIGLAKLREGLELVRIGKPVERELATWRYGDQFGKRRRKHLMLGGAGIVASTAMATIPYFGVQYLGVTGSLIALLGTAVATSRAFLGTYSDDRRDDESEAVAVAIDDRTKVRLSKYQIDNARLRTGARLEDLQIRFDHLDRPRPHVGIPGFLQSNRTRQTTQQSLDPSITLSGDHALRVLSDFLPQLNVKGASRNGVQDAYSIVENAKDITLLLKRSMARSQFIDDGETLYSSWGQYLTSIPEDYRLALEMSLHSEDERRAMEGELAALEARWRDADAIAAIADNMFVSPAIHERLANIKSDRRNE